MKKNKLINIITHLLVGLMVFLSSCVNIKGPAASVSPLPTFYIATTSTHAINSSIPTLTESVTASVTFIPTMAETERESLLINLIQKPGNCKLPCWWGFTPGISSWQEPKFFLSHLYGDPQKTINDHIAVAVDLNKLAIYQQLEIIKDNNTDVVSQIKFDVNGDYNPSGFQSIWSSFSPQNMLAIYGKPSRVLLITSTGIYAENPGNNIRAVYELWLFYDLSGFLIRYESIGEIQGDKIQICPIFRSPNDLWKIWLYIQSPTSPAPLEYMVDDYQGLIAELHPLANTTALSIDQFMVLSQSNSFCFDTPVSIWP